MTLLTDTPVDNRRREHRQDTSLSVTALYPGFWAEKGIEELSGQTYDLSPNGLCFTLPCEIPAGDVLLHLALPNIGSTYIHGEIVGFLQEPETDSWKYHVHFVDFLAGADPQLNSN